MSNGDRTRASTSRIRKVLIDSGAYETSRTRKAAELRSRGFTLSEIAEILHVCPKTVSAYLPYEKGAYGKAEASKNALKLRTWWEKKGGKIGFSPWKFDVNLHKKNAIWEKPYGEFLKRKIEMKKEKITEKCRKVFGAMVDRLYDEGGNYNESLWLTDIVPILDENANAPTWTEKVAWYTYFVCCDWEDGIAKNLPFVDEMIEAYKGVEKLLNRNHPVYITNLFTDRGCLYTGSYFVDPQTGETTPIPEEDRAVKERYRIR